jgi:DNA-binding NtrC family response regulator
MSGAMQAFVSQNQLPSLKCNLLVLDDDRSWRESAREVGQSLGCTVTCVDNEPSAMRTLASRPVDLMLLNPAIAAGEGVGLVSRIRECFPETEIIAVSADATVDSVLAALKAGAHQFLRKPVLKDELQLIVDRAAEKLEASRKERDARERLKADPGFLGLVGISAEMQKLYRMITRVSSSRHPVMILGESGTGKEKLARAIHNNGEAKPRPFVTVDCKSLTSATAESELFGHARGALPGSIRPRDGALLLANGGTLFLDHVSELPAEVQGKLVRALQEHAVRPLGGTKGIACDFRVIAAADTDIEAAVQQGSFRRDLFFRLNVVTLRLPPLRERKEDIQLLAEFVLQRLSSAKRTQFALAPEAMKTLIAYDWPGNVRELENCLESAVAVSPISCLAVDAFPPEVRAGSTYSKGTGGIRRGSIVPLAELERQAILSTLEQLHGDKIMTARLLGIGKTTLYRKLKEYGITDHWPAPAEENQASGA